MADTTTGTVDLHGQQKRIRGPRPKTAILSITCQCRGCGAEFHPKGRDRMTYCSRQCAFVARGIKRAAAKAARLIALRSVAKTCAKCSGQIAPKGRRVCDACKVPPPVYERRQKVTIQCITCDAEVTGTAARRRCDNCKRSEARRIRKHRQRARHFGVAYENLDPLLVFERDRWLCQICGVKTPKKLRGTIELRAPELDHRIPMAKGGPHLMENVQCACRACNMMKSDKLILGQMRLFA